MGERVNGKDLRKHRADVCSLVGLLPGDARLHLDGTLREDAQAFLEDFNDYISRETSAKKRRALTEVRATLENATLVSCRAFFSTCYAWAIFVGHPASRKQANSTQKNEPNSVIK